MGSGDDREHNEAGHFVEEYPLTVVMDVFDAVEGPAIITADVVDELECGRETARQKLLALEKEGRIKGRKKGRVTLWWPADDEAEDNG
ncbi:hypothetical protein [Halocatena halophila]|uniref:hypothetical protein n=1 Tax=Halocatena halophila TaxID=2814576 RepID=UPI002ED3D840